MLKLINPIYLLKHLNKMRRELSNLIFYYKVINEMSTRNILVLNKLKIDGLRRVYTFLNLKPELLMHEKDILANQEKQYVGNHLLKIQNIFSEHDLYELIKFKYKRVQTHEYYGYRIHGFFFFRSITIWWIIWYVLYGFGVYKIIQWVDWSFLQVIVQKISDLFI